MTSTFATLPFESQLEEIERICARDEAQEIRALLRACARLPDPVPLVALVQNLAARDTLSHFPGELEESLRQGTDTTLQAVLVGATASAPLREALVELSVHALLSWPVERIAGLVLMRRWLRDVAPARHEEVLHEAEVRTSASPARGTSPLLHVSGERLVALADSDAWRVPLAETRRAVLDALAHAPKSLSQANAESLLAREVYADPGHFFFELLQNADDAGASVWSVDIDEAGVRVEHDGSPFSFADVVGVLSIGQTTKRSDQIGQFGVGFKSVYEVCERPRISSGVFDFEIAHVSIPREMRSEPRHETHLRLPFAREVDVPLLVNRARSLPPETLLTLPHVQRVSVRAPTESWSWTTEGEGLVEVREGESSLGRYRQREESGVLVAIAVDGDGNARSKPEPTLYAFLPTREQSGLRVMVHARFDVTLDRERLEHASLRNEELLAKAGVLFAELVAEMLREGAEVLPCLAAPSTASPSTTSFLDAAHGLLSELPLFRPAAPLAPSVRAKRGRLLRPALAHALRELDLDGAVALGPLDAREAEIARWLGAREVSPADLLALLRARLESGAEAPSWLSPVVLAALAELPPAALRDLPVLSDPAGRLASPREAMIASAAVAELYATPRVRALVDERSLRALPASLRDVVTPARFPREQLVADLLDPSTGPALSTRRHELRAVLREMDAPTREALRHAPLLRDRAGHPASASELRALVPSLRPWADYLASGVALASDADAREFADWLPPFDGDALARELRAAPPDDTGRRALARRLLDEVAPALPARATSHIAQIPLFDDVHGVARPLRGAGAARVADADLPSLIPDWPWLAVGGEFVDTLGSTPPGAEEVAQALVGGQLASGDGLLAWMAEHAGDLSRSTVSTLGRAAIWTDRDGVASPSSDLLSSVGSRDAGLAAGFYEFTRLRREASAGAAALADALGTPLAPPTVGTALADLHRVSTPLPEELLADLLNAACATLAPAELERLTTAAIFLDESGEPRALGRWELPIRTACAHVAGARRGLLREAGVPLLAETLELRLGDFLARTRVLPADPDALVELAASGAFDASTLLAALAEEELGEETRARLAALPIFPAHDGTLHRLDDLWRADQLAPHLAPAVVSALGLERRFARDDIAEAARGLPARGRDELALTLASTLVDGRALDEQPAPFCRWDGFRGLLRLVGEEAPRLRVDTLPLVLDDAGRLRAGVVSRADPASGELLRMLGDSISWPAREWLEVAPEVLLDTLTAPVSLRRVADTLRRVASSELDASESPLAEPSLVYGWIRAHRDALASDEDALAAMSGAAILPSERGPLRAPRDLVLDPAAPDLGLAWGVAAEVPPDIRGFFAEHFDLDRKQRRNVIDHVLDGLDAAASAGDAERSAELIEFLARRLDTDPGEMEERARHTKVRARLRVPVTRGGETRWEKPRHAYLAGENLGAVAEDFCDPPRVALSPLSSTARALLVACGARAELDEDLVRGALAGESRRTGIAASRALARHVLERVQARPELARSWDLEKRAWLLARDDSMRRPRDLFWPSDLAETLLRRSSPELLPDEGLCRGLPPALGDRLGLRRVETLPLAELAQLLDGATPATILAWLDEGLHAGRLSAADVRQHLRPRLRLTSDAGRLRPPEELAIEGAVDAFGSWRGDYSEGLSFPALMRALGIPARPNPRMARELLAELAAHESFDDERIRDVVAATNAALELLAEGGETRLAPDTWVGCRERGELRLCRLSESRLRAQAPVELSSWFTDEFLELEPHHVEPGLHALLLASGVPDLWGEVAWGAPFPGPEREDLRDEAEALQWNLRRGLGDAVGRRVRVATRLGREARRGGARREIPVDAAVYDDTLHLTVSALEEPVRIATALEPDARARAALMRWLRAGEWDRGMTRDAPAEAPAPADAPGPSLFGKVRSFFLRKSETPAGPSTTSRPRSDTPAAIDLDADRENFSLRAHIESQLSRTEGWLTARARAASFGFTFTPDDVPAPWVYAPNLVGVEMRRRQQEWILADLPAPPLSGEAGMMSFRGKLPPGEAVLPVPLRGRVLEASVDGVSVHVEHGPSGLQVIRLRGQESFDIRFRVALAPLPDLANAEPADTRGATRSFVPDDELPEEALDFVAELGDVAPALERAIAIRDFIRRRYRYDPSYMEDPALGRWLARITRGRANAHIAALHAGRSEGHLGAGVCYELNTLAVELMRRAGLPAAVATGWVLRGGEIADPDHLWALVLLRSARGRDVWVPIDASSTRSGRPLQISRRPAGSLPRPRRDRRTRAPAAPRLDLGGHGRGESPGGRSKRPKRGRKTPRAELLALVRHLERVTGETITDAERDALRDALGDKDAARALLARLRGPG